MSKISAKARYTQLKEWLPTLKSYRDKYMKKDDPKRGKRFSKSDHYRKVRNRYGNKSN
jgi:hypothetical protein|tara:strand:+ start:509 stop:682 length:174 start_codon:yes stop_codon:yes gene_type:complete